jgi:hypothetical protein
LFTLGGYQPPWFGYKAFTWPNRTTGDALPAYHMGEPFWKKFFQMTALVDILTVTSLKFPKPALAIYDTPDS